MTTHTPRIIALTIISVCAIVLSGCSKNTADQNATANKTPTLAVCTKAGLSASLSGIDGTAGTFYRTLTVTNTGTTSCTFTGTAKLALQDASGTELSNVSSPATNMTLTPGKSIYASVAFPDANNFTNTSACKSGAVTVAFYAPNQTTSIQAYDARVVSAGSTIDACPGFALNAFSTTKP